MKPPGTYKIRYQRRRQAAGDYDSESPLPRPATLASDAAAATAGAEDFLAQLARSEHRVRRILDSLRSEILDGGDDANLRIRQIFRTPREIFRLELERPSLGYQRTTLLDREALEELLQTDAVRAQVDATLG